MSTNLSIERLQRATVVDQDGDKIGDVGQVYVDDATGAPSWVTVRTGLFGTKETFIPLDRAESDASGVRVPYEKRFVKDAPNMDEDEHLSPEQEAELYRYYGLGGGAVAGLDAGRDADVGRTTPGTGTAGLEDDDASRAAGAPAEGGYTDVDGHHTARHSEGEYTDVNGHQALRHEEGEYTDVAGDPHGPEGEGEYTDADRGRSRLTDTGDTAGTAGYANPGSPARLDDTTTGTSGVDEEAIGTTGYTADLREPGAETSETGRPRLRKHVVTDTDQGPRDTDRH